MSERLIIKLFILNLLYMTIERKVIVEEVIKEI